MGAYFCPESTSQKPFVRQKYSSTDNPTATGSCYQQVSTPRSLPPPIEEKKHSLDDFIIKGSIGQGGFASVYLVQHKNNSKKTDKKQYAMKKLGKKKMKQRKALENLKIERMVYTSMKNNFIVNLNYAFQDKSFCYFVMEYAQGGDVYSLINNPKQPAKVKMYRQLGEEGAKFILACVILGLECAHSHNIVYRDLKPQNVLLFKNGYLKLTDFGLAKQVKPDQMSLTIAGTKIYYAPQILQKKGYNKSVDFWTLGVFLHQLILFYPPFDSHSIIPGKFTNVCLRAQRNRDWKGSNISSEAKNLINSFLKVNPSQRLGSKGFQQIKNHAFFRSFNWQLLNQMRMQSPLAQIATSFPINLKSINSFKSKQTVKDLDFQIEGLTFQPDILKQHNDYIL